MAAQAGQSPARVGDDGDNVLGSTYKPRGLTAILVRRSGTVASVVPDLTPPRRLNLQSSLGQLGSAGR